MEKRFVETIIWWKGGGRSLCSIGKRRKHKEGKTKKRKRNAKARKKQIVNSRKEPGKSRSFVKEGNQAYPEKMN